MRRWPCSQQLQHFWQLGEPGVGQAMRATQSDTNESFMTVGQRWPAQQIDTAKNGFPLS